MRVALTALSLSLTAVASHGEDAGAPVENPKVLSRIVQALEESGINYLTSKVSVYDGREESYHLARVDYLGSIRRDEKTFVVATAGFIRSRPKGSQNSARGHGFILLLDPSFKIVSHARIDGGDYRLSSEVLMLDGKPDVDFSKRDELTRYRGWLVGGDALMPYPFSDKISEAEWESGAFRKDAEVTNEPLDANLDPKPEKKPTG